MNKRAIVFLAGSALAVSLFAQNAGTLTEQYRDSASKLIDASLADQGGMEKLAYLCDRIGNRLSGSAALEKAVAWAAAQMKADGLTNVVTPRVKVPHWVRGNESASLLEPVNRPLTILGLGGSIATPKRGITAEVVPVSSFEDLDKKGRAAIEGKIVLFNVPYEGYNRTVVYRTTGPSRAARLGAVAALVRSVTPVSLQSPHTGALEYADGFPKIPAAAVTIEDALLIQRLVDAGNPVIVHLEMEAHMLPDADSANVIGEIPGRERPDEVVVIGGHLDSWDVGAGAQDDGSGCITALEAAHIIHALGLTPRRTLRVVFWTNEENGGAGGEAYRAWAGDTVKNHVAAIEMDGGAEKPVGFGLSANGDLQASAGTGARNRRVARSHRCRVHSTGRRRRRHRAHHGGRRAGTRAAHGGHALFRLASLARRYHRQSEARRFARQYRRHGGDGLCAGRHAGAVAPDHVIYSVT